MPLQSLQKPLPPSACNSPTSSTTVTAVVTPVKIYRVQSEQNQECLSPSGSDTVTAIVTPIKLKTKLFARETFQNSSWLTDFKNNATVTPLKICRRPRTAPKISDSQSSHDYILKTKTVEIPSVSNILF